MDLELQKVLPKDLVNLTLSFLDLHEFWHPRLQPEVYSPYRGTYDLQIPRAAFRDTVWSDRLEHPDTCPGVRITACRRLKREETLPAILSYAFSTVGLSAHAQCNSGFARLLREVDLYPKEIEYISQHLLGDWFPHFDRLIEGPATDFVRAGLGSVIARCLLRIIESREFKDLDAYNVLCYVTGKLEVEDPEFLKRVFIPNRVDFLQMYYAIELFYTEDTALNEAISEKADLLHEQSSFAHTQPDVCIVIEEG